MDPVPPLESLEKVGTKLWSNVADYRASCGFAGAGDSGMAGHKYLAMTRRHMHLSRAALDSAIRLVEEPAGPLRAGRGAQDSGDVGETAPTTKNDQ